MLINGTVGAGKTSVAEMVGDLLTEAGMPNAVIDLDWLRRSWPSPESRPNRH
jgi:adenylylsulfate kinase-like enzyme